MDRNILVLGKDFEALVIEIVDNIFPMEKNNILKNILSEDDSKLYLENHIKEITEIIYTGFKKSQELIIKGLLQIQSEQKELKKQLKEAGRQKDNKKDLQNNISILEYKEVVLKHLADTIFWHLILGKLHIARRFYQNVSGSKYLEETNYKSVLHVADDINSKSDNFVLLTDITNYVQIGDLFGIVDGELGLFEVKEGEKNIRIINDLSAIGNYKSTVIEFFDKYKDCPKDLKQIKRIIKQQKVAKDEITIINTDKGYEPTTGRNIKIITPKDDTLYYYDDLHNLEQQFNTRNFWAYIVIDECLHIGLYKNKWRILGEPLLETIAEEQNIRHKIIVDATCSMKTANCPILFLPFSKQLIINILLGNVIMYLMLDIDKYMQLYERFGATCQWSSRKEATRVNESLKNNLFLYENRALKVKKANGKEFILAGGTFDKILFNHIRPAYMAYSSNYYTDSI